MLLQCVSISEHRIQYSRVLKSRRNSVVMNIHLEDLMGDTDLTDYLKDCKITLEMFELQVYVQDLNGNKCLISNSKITKIMQKRLQNGGASVSMPATSKTQ